MSREISRPLYRKSCGKNAEGAEQAADRENKDQQRRHTGMQEQRREINGLADCSAAAEPECIANLRHPTAYAMGAGAQTIIMLDTVPIWFEIWRTLNGFPPNFYAKDEKPAK